MSLPDNVRVDWGTLGDLADTELVPFLQNAYKELRIGSEQAAALVTVESFQAILKLMNNEKTSDLASYVLKCAWGQFQQEDQLFLIERFKTELGDESELITGLKVDLIGQVHHQKAKEILMELIKHTAVGVKTISHLQKYPINSNELSMMAAGITDPMILLRVIDLASKSSIETQKWASTALFDLISKSRDDPLLLINVFELLSDLDVTVIHESISLLHQCLFDPMIQIIDSAKCSLMKIFTNYYAKTELALPEWYFVQLFGDNPDSPGSFALQSILYLAQNRPSLIDVIRLKSSLSTLIKKFYTAHDYELVIADLLAVLIENDEFDFWFPDNAAKHYFTMSNDPNLEKREKSLTVILSCAQYEQSIAHFHRIDEFTGLLEGSGCSALRIKIAQKLSSFGAFEAAFGERLTTKWQSAKADTIEIYDPNVATMEM